MTNEEMKMTLNEMVKNFGTRMSKEALVDKLYNMIAREHHDVCVLNEKYLIVDGVTYQFIKRKTGWETKAF